MGTEWERLNLLLQLAIANFHMDHEGSACVKFLNLIQSYILNYIHVCVLISILLFAFNSQHKLLWFHLLLLLFCYYCDFPFILMVFYVNREHVERTKKGELLMWHHICHKQWTWLWLPKRQSCHGKYNTWCLMGFRLFFATFCHQINSPHPIS